MQCAELLNKGEKFFNHIILVFHETFIIHMFPVLSWIKLFLQVEEHFQLNLTHICMSLHQRWNYLIRSDRVENGCKNAWNCFSSYYCTFHISHALSPQCRTIFYKCLNRLTWFHQHNCCVSVRSDWVDIKMCGKIVWWELCTWLESKHYWNWKSWFSELCQTVLLPAERGSSKL